MIFKLEEEHLSVKEAAREFAKTRLKEGVIERDSSMAYPTEFVKEMGEMGFLSMMTDPKYGGSGMDTLSYVLAMEEISKIDSSCSVIMSVNNSLVLFGLEEYGTEEQKQKYIPRLTTGAEVGCFCLSEPEAGSDATSQRTTAIDKGDHYVLNGVKNWITNGGKATIQLVIAHTDKEKGHKGINVFIVERDWEGVTIGPKEDKMGIRSSDTHSISYADVKVPKENRIGADGFGFKFAMQTLEGGRIGIAAQALGIAQGAYEASLRYAHEREAFGKPIAHHQMIMGYLADMATKIEASRHLVYKASWSKQQHYEHGGPRHSKEASMAKLYAGDTAMWVSERAIQIHGGYGYTKEFPVERFFRDAKITQIYEGTQEVQRIVIARSLL